MSEKKADVLDFPIKDKECPVCGKNAVSRFEPFCSKRCADIDLGKWLNGSYSISGKDGEAVSEIFEENN